MHQLIERVVGQLRSGAYTCALLRYVPFPCLEPLQEALVISVSGVQERCDPWSQ